VSDKPDNDYKAKFSSMSWFYLVPREYLIFCVFEPYFAKEREYGDQERDFRRAAEG